ncbi:MAG: ribonuclease HI [Deltaproteobacteria bacterium]|nr:ribonuclease HI [Deltaproteobacteria bacterium]
MKKVTIYTDGGCLGNPGPGGYGVVLLYGEHRRELSEGFRETTNNRMELLACIKALEMLKERCAVTLHSDSKYVVDGINLGWARRWRQNQWIRDRKSGARALNPDLWQRLLEQTERHQVTMCWVKGHAGNAENERCDELANAAARAAAQNTDQGYLNSRAATNN